MPVRTITVSYTHKELIDLIAKDAKEQFGSQPGGVEVKIHIIEAQRGEDEVTATVTFKNGGK